MRALTRSAVWAAGWALGVALGVSLGAYLTATSGVGAPGVSSVDTAQLVWLPASAGAVVFVLALLGYLIHSARRGSAQVRGETQDDRGE